MFEQMRVDNPTEYYHHIFCATGPGMQSPVGISKTYVNDANLQRMLNVVWPNPTPGKMLFLGAGRALKLGFAPCT